MRIGYHVGALAALVIVSGCGGGGAGGGGATATRWNETDACKTLDKAIVAKAAGQAVTEATLDSSSDNKDVGVRMSMCTYHLEHGLAGVMIRSTDDALTDEQIQEMRTAGGAMPIGEEVPGLGMKASWSSVGRSLQVFPDRKHYINITAGPDIVLPGTPPPPFPDPKTLAVTLAKALL